MITNRLVCGLCLVLVLQPDFVIDAGEGVPEMGAATS